MRFFIPVICLSIAWHGPAYGYIDPGSGSAIMSAIIGMFVAISMVMKTYWYKIKSIFSRRAISASEPSNQDKAADEIAHDDSVS